MASDPTYVEKAKNGRSPTNHKQAESFGGLAHFYGRYNPNFTAKG